MFIFLFLIVLQRYFEKLCMLHMHPLVKVIDRAPIFFSGFFNIFSKIVLKIYKKLSNRHQNIVQYMNNQYNVLTSSTIFCSNLCKTLFNSAICDSSLWLHTYMQDFTLICNYTDYILAHFVIWLILLAVQMYLAFLP